MQKSRLLIALIAIVVVFAGCSSYSKVSSEEPSESMMAKPTPVMTLPVTTTSDEAREHFTEGLFAFDMVRGYEARMHFGMAVESDPTFALAHLYLANSSTSFEAFATNLRNAEENAGSASKEEQLLIEITRKGFDNDIEGQIASANALLEIAPESPRAYLALAGVQASMNEHGEARMSIDKAIMFAPKMVSAHTALGNSYLFGEPTDLEAAKMHMQMASDLVPTEPNPYDLLGDVYRAQGELEKARDSYTEAGKYSGENGSPFQQRGHVNSFLGEFDAARADYDKAIAMARGNQAASTAVFKAYIHVHAGDPSAAIDELKTLVAGIDDMDIPSPTGAKIFALGSAITIALHQGMIDEAEALVSDWSEQMRIRIEKVGTDKFNRAQTARIAYVEGMLAVKKGEFDKAKDKISEIAKLVESDANPRKMEPAHELMGAISLEQGRHEEAAGHFQQGNHANNIYIKYQLAKALEGAGQTEEAMKLYWDVANWNFNGAGAALTRKEAMEKSMSKSDTDMN